MFTKLPFLILLTIFVLFFTNFSFAQTIQGDEEEYVKLDSNKTAQDDEEDDEAYIQGGIYKAQELSEITRSQKAEQKKNYKNQKNEILIDERDKNFKIKVYRLVNRKKKIYKDIWITFRVGEKFSTVQDKAFDEFVPITRPPDNVGPITLYYELLVDDNYYVYGISANIEKAKFKTTSGLDEHCTPKEILKVYPESEKIGEKIFVKPYRLVFEINENGTGIEKAIIYDDLVFFDIYNKTCEENGYTPKSTQKNKK